MKISDAPMTADIAGALQRTDTWYADRCGKVTASPILKVYKKLKNGGYSSEREGYFYQVLAEVLTGVPASGFKNAAMQRGIDKEAEVKLMLQGMQGPAATVTIDGREKLDEAAQTVTALASSNNEAWLGALQALTQAVQTMTQVAQAVAAPKAVVRDAQGKVVGVQAVNLQ